MQAPDPPSDDFKPSRSQLFSRWFYTICVFAIELMTLHRYEVALWLNVTLAAVLALLTYLLSAALQRLNNRMRRPGPWVDRF